MAFQLTLPLPWPKQRWKVKIRDCERVEPPHVTILCKSKAWRLGLRDKCFLDRKPDPGEVPDELLSEVWRQMERLRKEWDAMYPENPVKSEPSEESADEGRES